MTEKDFVTEAKKLLDRGMPVLELHTRDDQQPFGVLLTAEHLSSLLDLIPNDRADEKFKLLLVHDHISGEVTGGRVRHINRHLPIRPIPPAA